MKFTVCIISRPNYKHSSVFSEIAETIHFALLELGHDSIISSNLDFSDRIYIILGSNLIDFDTMQLPPCTILYNFEQVHDRSPWVNERVISEFKNYLVLDYNAENIQAWQHYGVNRCQLLKLGYMPQLSRINPPLNQDIDVLFYGSMNKRRRKILIALRARGIKIKVLPVGMYGKERDDWISRAKIVVDIHYYETKLFNVVRFAHLLSNRKFVVSEYCSDPIGVAEFSDGVVFCRYDEIVDVCIEYLQKPEKRELISLRGFELFSQRKETYYLNAVLPEVRKYAAERAVESNTSELVCVDLGCGSRKADKHIGVDIVAVEGVDIVANLNGPFPFADSSIDRLRAYDSLEHFVDRIHTMNEIWRICKPNAMVEIFVPSSDGRGAFQDPTHVSFWNVNSFQYYSVESPASLSLCKAYGFKGAFSLQTLQSVQGGAEVVHIRAILKAVKSDVRAMVEQQYKLQNHNFYACPDWTQPKVQLTQVLELLLQAILVQAQEQATCLLLDRGNCPDGLDLPLILQQVLETAQKAHQAPIQNCTISIVGAVELERYDSLIDRIDARIQLDQESDVTALFPPRLRSIQLERLSQPLALVQ
ncbi:MAG: methyltransferase domain-containing protein [Synechococcus sp.]